MNAITQQLAEALRPIVPDMEYAIALSGRANETRAVAMSIRLDALRAALAAYEATQARTGQPIEYDPRAISDSARLLASGLNDLRVSVGGIDESVPGTRELRMAAGLAHTAADKFLTTTQPEH